MRIARYGRVNMATPLTPEPVHWIEVLTGINQVQADANQRQAKKRFALGEFAFTGMCAGAVLMASGIVLVELVLR